MHRLFGTAKPKADPISLDETVGKIDARADGLDGKIQKLDKELREIRERMKRARGSGLNSLKQRALRILKQKKMYESQREQLMNQSFNVEQASFATQTLGDTVNTVAAMKQGAATMKQQFKTIDIDKIEDIQDDLADMLEQNSEIQEILGQNYACDDVDESELESELDALGDELLMDEEEDLNFLPAVPAQVSEPTAAFEKTENKTETESSMQI